MVEHYNLCTGSLLNIRRKFYISFPTVDTIKFRKNLDVEINFEFEFFFQENSEYPITILLEWAFKAPEINAIGDWDSFDRFFPLTEVPNGLAIFHHLLPGDYFYRFFENEYWNFSTELLVFDFKNEAYHRTSLERPNINYPANTSTLDPPSNLDLFDHPIMHEKAFFFYPYKGIISTPPAYVNFIRQNVKWTYRRLVKKNFHSEICLSSYIYLNHAFFFLVKKKSENNSSNYSNICIRFKEKIFNLLLSPFSKFLKFTDNLCNNKLNYLSFFKYNQYYKNNF